MTPNLKDRIAVVTGASRGIGYFTVLNSPRPCAHVVACARTLGGLEELGRRDQGFSAVRQRSSPSISRTWPPSTKLGGAINERWGKLDIMVANAGVLGTISPIGHVEAKVFER
ncbi:SDR family NAD(P)-dependent oxidoreductase [Sinorhizobium meliloti]|nr:SDR family NAD(P)-dependent oxidoreductase [Sinorhizobium meliloti]